MYIHSNSVLFKEISILANYQDSLTRQISESDLSVASSNDTTTTTNTLSSSSTFNMDRSLPLKKC
ncbi:unnamed protein product, partial [Rotaria magnacalcarata]